MFSFRKTLENLKGTKPVDKTPNKLSNKEIVHKLREVVEFVEQEMTDTKFTVRVCRL
jgi:hypothetical protein